MEENQPKTGKFTLTYGLLVTWGCRHRLRHDALQ